MEEKERSGANQRRRNREDHSNDIRLRLLDKNGDKMMTALECGKMVGILSGSEVMYMFIDNNYYKCYIHKLDAEEGRAKAWEINDRNTAMFKNLNSAADRMFEITPKQGMDPLGVMVAAEQGIISFLDHTGQLPVDDVDFMSWQGESDTSN